MVGVDGLTFNKTSLIEVCNYIYEADLYFIVQLTAPVKYSFDIEDWILNAKQEYGERFIGIYYYDEPGGRRLDDKKSRFVKDPKNYIYTAERYVRYLYIHLEPYLRLGVNLYTADYGLYWFDYQVGYETVLCEFGWNHSRELHTALCRGAAEMHGKGWGAIITWTHRKPPYIESADELYYDMLLAYLSGAKYVVVFNFPKIGRYGILTEGHFQALKNFWDYI